MTMVQQHNYLSTSAETAYDTINDYTFLLVIISNCINTKL